MKTYLIPMTKSGALISGNKNWNQSTPSFLSLSHLPDIMETSCYDLVGNDIPQPDPYSEIQENYGENLIVATEQKVKAWTFYCDSVEWDDNALWGNTSSEEKRNCLKTVNKSGDGSKENPWRNVNYALQKLECLADIESNEGGLPDCSGTFPPSALRTVRATFIAHGSPSINNLHYFLILP